MSVIKSITATMISKILQDDFHTSFLIADAEHRTELAQIDPADVSELIRRLNEALPVIQKVHTERRTEALEAIKAALPKGFASVEELIAAATGTKAKTKTKSDSAAANNNNKIFTVVIDRTEFKIVNKKIPASLRDNEAYQKLIKARPELEDVDKLMREYSTDYQQAYKYNAKYNGKLFHMNERGKLNEVSTEYFTDYQKKFTNGDIKDFKEHVRAEYKEHVKAESASHK